MSLINKSDVENHLSAHHRTEIHLAYPKSQSIGTGFAHEDPAGEDPKETDPVQNPLDIPTTSQPETVPLVACRSVKA
jgi:hypothetical protein